MSVASRAIYSVDIEGPIKPLSPGGAMFPESAIVQVLIADELVVTLRLRPIDGRPALVGVGFGPLGDWTTSEEISATDVHRVPVDDLVQDAVRAVAVNVAQAAPVPFRTDPAEAGTAALRVRRRRTMTDSLLSEVATIVLDDRNRDAPTRAVSEQLYCSYRTAGRWVAEARVRGLLRSEVAREVSTEEEQQ